jgi:hypothetical protein
MSQQNVQTVRQVYAIWNGEPGTPDPLSLYDPDVEFVNPESAVEGGCATGTPASWGGLAGANLLQTSFNEGAPHDRCLGRPPRGPAAARLLLLLAI